MGCIFGSCKQKPVYELELPRLYGDPFITLDYHKNNYNKEVSTRDYYNNIIYA